MGWVGGMENKIWEFYLVVHVGQKLWTRWMFKLCRNRPHMDMKINFSIRGAVICRTLGKVSNQHVQMYQMPQDAITYAQPPAYISTLYAQ